MAVTFTAHSRMTPASTDPNNTKYSLDENPNGPVLLGTFSGLDPSKIYAFDDTAGTKNPPYSSLFSLVEKTVNGVKAIELYVKDASLFDYEAAVNSFQVGIADAAKTDGMSVQVDLKNVNEAPTGINIVATGTTSPVASVTIQENVSPTSAAVALGTLYALDPDRTDINYGRPSCRYQIDPTDPFAGLYEIVPNASNTGYILRIKQGAVVDYDSLPENAKYHDLKIIVTDAKGTGFQVPTVLRINITNNTSDDVPTNPAPTNVRWASNDQGAIAIDENKTDVGTVTADDNNQLTYSFFGTNNPNASLFNITNAGVITLKAGVNCEALGTNKFYDVIVNVSDGTNNVQRTLRVNINDVNEAASKVNFSEVAIVQVGTAGQGASVVKATAVDPDTNPAFQNNQYRFSNEQLTDPSGLFQIDAATGQITTTRAVTAADVGQKTLTVVAYDGTLVSGTFNHTFNVLAAGNTAPIITVVNPPGRTTSDRVDIQAFKDVTIQDAGRLKVVVKMDHASKGVFTGNGGTPNNDDGTFTIFGTADEVTTVLQALRFNARDKAPGSAAEETTFTITVTDPENAISSNDSIKVKATAPGVPPANRGPTDLSLSNVKTLQELHKTGDEIATISAKDLDGDNLTYKIILANGTAVDTDGYFTVSGNKLLIANGVMFDAEQALSRQVSLQVSDNRGGVTQQTFNFNISDKNPEVMAASDTSPFNDIIKGSQAGNFRDVFYGGAGDDKLWGGYGNDTLWGGTGKDTFVFHGKLGTSTTDRRVNFDTIKDYSVKEDSIWLEADLFKSNKALYAATKKGTEIKPLKMASKFFTVGDKAKDADDYFVYDAKKRVLYYDADGSGSKAAIEMATFTNNKALKNFNYKELFFI